MNINDTFALASQKKFRFNTVQGNLSVEDLWDLPLTTTRSNVTSLDDIAIALDKKIKDTGSTTSFVKKTTRTDDDLRACFDIVLYVIESKQAAAEAATALTELKAKKERIMQIIAQKQDASLAEKSVDELSELLKSF